jgi:hypothetical protein
MAGFTGIGLGDEGVACDQASSRFFMEDVAALAAQSFLQHDVRHGVVHAFPSHPGVEDLLGLVEVHMAGLAIGDGFDVLVDLVLDIQMTLVAFDLVLGDMGGVHEVRVIVLLETFLLGMALVAVFPGYRAVSYNHVAVALIAGVSVVEHRGVIVA